VNLRPYQTDLVREIRTELEYFSKAPLVVLPTGGGKTFISAQVTLDFPGKVWFIAHRQELINQASGAFTTFGIDHGIVKSGVPFDPSKRVQVASVQTLVRRLSHGYPAPDLIITDECFPAGTRVDGDPIELIREGDEVMSFNHATQQVEPRKVLGNLTRQHGGSWVRVTCASGETFVCTDTHPIYVKHVGYTPARNLVKIPHHELQILRRANAPKSVEPHLREDVLQSELQDKTQSGYDPRSGVQKVWGKVQTKVLQRGIKHPFHGIRLLLQILWGKSSRRNRFRNHVENQSEVCVRKDEKEQPYVCSRVQGENDAGDARQKIQRTGRQRESHTTAKVAALSNRIEDGARDTNPRMHAGSGSPAFQLQGGLGGCRFETGDRSRWEGASSSKDQIAGCKEDLCFEFTGVDSVEIYERRSGSRPEWVPVSDTVHNIHVEGNNNYFAEGILVHNCHHATAASYGKIYAAFPGASLLGVTATPCRMNGSGLGSVFDTMILGPSNQWLTDKGFLCPAKYYAPPQKADLSNVHTRAGDYIVSELEEAMDDGEITGDAVSHYRRLCDGVPMLVFCVSVAHAHHVAEQYAAAGYRAAAVDGKLTDEERADRIKGLGTGKYQIITSCDLIGEGLDVPVVSAVQLLRPTQSPALHLQQIGRGLRPAAGKEYLTVLDHVGNTRKHGFAATERQWSLDGLKKKDAKPPAIRTCEVCYSVHRTAPVCPFCNYEYPVKPRTLTAKKVIDGELVEVEQTAEERREEVANASTFAELVAIAKARGYKRPTFWAMKVRKTWSRSVVMPKV